MSKPPVPLVHRPLHVQIVTVLGLLCLSIGVAWIVAQASLMAYRLYRAPLAVPEEALVHPPSAKVITPTSIPELRPRTAIRCR